jgi:hypothetical protein
MDWQLDGSMMLDRDLEFLLCDRRICQNRRQSAGDKNGSTQEPEFI